MKNANGLPARMDFSAIPSYYLNIIMPEVGDMDELKTSLHFFRILYRKKGHPRYVSFSEMASEPAEIESIRQNGQAPEKSLRKAIGKVIQRGIILNLDIETGGQNQSLYLLNTAANREAVEEIRNGTLTIDAGIPAPPTAGGEKLTDIFSYYEENIGMLTPLIADELKLAEQHYPRQWIVQAIRESAINNKRNWRYISRILERWSTEGKTDGAYRQDHTADDPAKYTRGKYQRFVQR